MRRNNGFLTALIAFVVGIIVGWGALSASARGVPSRVAGISSSSPVNAAFDTKSSNLRLSLNSLLHEHTVLGAGTLTALYEGADASRFMQLMQTNENQLASLVGEVYGGSTKDSFVQLWTEHMNDYQNYTLSKKANNTAGMNAAKQDLQQVAQKLGNLFGSTNLPSSTISNLMQQHINDMLSVVDAVAGNDATGVANAVKNGYDQAGNFADTLTKAMLLDKSDKF